MASNNRAVGNKYALSIKGLLDRLGGVTNVRIALTPLLSSSQLSQQLGAQQAAQRLRQLA